VVNLEKYLQGLANLEGMNRYFSGQSYAKTSFNASSSTDALLSLLQCNIFWSEAENFNRR